MNTKRLFISLVGLIGLLVSGCAAPTPVMPTPTITPTFIVTVTPSSPPTFTPSPTANPADRFAGVWSGTMSFSDNPDHKEDITITIPVNCKPGGFCGDFGNNTLNCRAALKLVAVRGDVIEYELDLTPTLDDRCLESGGGTLTLQADGTLFREHKTPDLTVSGILTRK